MAGSLKTDAPFYTEAELDLLEATDPVAALRIAREQLQLHKRLDAQALAGTGGELPGIEALQSVMEEVRQILARDGGDIEFVALEQQVLTVRLKGSCSGCPRAALDLQHVVAALVRRRYPQISAVRNIF